MKYKMNDIYNIDNMELMKEFPDNYFDLASQRIADFKAQTSMFEEQK